MQMWRSSCNAQLQWITGVVLKSDGTLTEHPESLKICWLMPKLQYIHILVMEHSNKVVRTTNCYISNSIGWFFHRHMSPPTNDHKWDVEPSDLLSLLCYLMSISQINKNQQWQRVRVGQEQKMKACAMHGCMQAKIWSLALARRKTHFEMPLWGIS